MMIDVVGARPSKLRHIFVRMRGGLEQPTDRAILIVLPRSFFSITERNYLIWPQVSV